MRLERVKEQCAEIIGGPAARRQSPRSPSGHRSWSACCSPCALIVTFGRVGSRRGPIHPISVWWPPVGVVQPPVAGWDVVTHFTQRGSGGPNETR
jgi:hypothetical protein